MLVFQNAGSAMAKETAPTGVMNFLQLAAVNSHFSSENLTRSAQPFLEPGLSIVLLEAFVDMTTNNLSIMRYAALNLFLFSGDLLFFTKLCYHANLANLSLLYLRRLLIDQNGVFVRISSRPMLYHSFYSFIYLSPDLFVLEAIIEWRKKKKDR